MKPMILLALVFAVGPAACDREAPKAPPIPPTPKVAAPLAGATTMTEPKKDEVKK
jgi:hypothetical protein